MTTTVTTSEILSMASAEMRGLDRLVGEREVAGGASGVVRYEWMAGGHFLLQHVALAHGDEAETGLEVIGHLHPFGGGQSEHLHSRYYGSGGNTLDYVYEMDGDELTIWAGGVASPAYAGGSTRWATS